MNLLKLLMFKMQYDLGVIMHRLVLCSIYNKNHNPIKLSPPPQKKTNKKALHFNNSNIQASQVVEKTRFRYPTSSVPFHWIV